MWSMDRLSRFFFVFQEQPSKDGISAFMGGQEHVQEVQRKAVA